MPRLFVAVDLPDAHRDALAALRTDAFEARWTPPAQYHLTLRFLGDLPEEQVPSLVERLANVSRPAFRLHGEGLGVFPSRRRPRVLFAALESTPALTALQERIEAAVREEGIPADPKPFTPHVTIARLKTPNPRPVQRFLDEHADFELPLFGVEAFYLYESTLRPSGAVHERRATFEMKAS